ncbi:hypothetical protein [Shinella zoogloeoides]|uniref:hypothetical protein n=1 Tax=Shinella zoogloeoides TaxID=352475 RepID=UPI00299DE3DB|nr:hypothetical protein [Shinella zoogloeoides]WPE22672.1 hypothetical protein ShzoTeo12_38890 [Shinella zoogloeoides]
MQPPSNIALKRKAGLAADQSSDISSVKAETFAKVRVLGAELFREQLPQSPIFLLELEQILHFLTGSCDRRDSLLGGIDNLIDSSLGFAPASAS